MDRVRDAFSAPSLEARLALGWIGVITLFRLWFAPHLDLVGDEAHYWECGRSLDWNHYGKGPGAAFVIRVFTVLLGDHVWVLRLPAVLLSAGTGWLIFLLGRKLYSEAGWARGRSCGISYAPLCDWQHFNDDRSAERLFWVAAALSFGRGCRQGKEVLDSDWVVDWSWFSGQIYQCSGAYILCSFSFDRAFQAKAPVFRKNGASTWNLCALGPTDRFWNAFYGWITAMHVFEGGDLNRGFQLNWGKFAGFWLLQAIVVLLCSLF